MQTVSGHEASFHVPFNSIPTFLDLTVATVSSAIHINYTAIWQFTLLSKGDPWDSLPQVTVY